jgi:hypothetical protein
MELLTVRLPEADENTVPEKDGVKPNVGELVNAVGNVTLTVGVPM